MADEHVFEAEALADRIKPLLAGRNPEVQGAVLVQLVATFIAGHHPELRNQIFSLHTETTRQMIPVAEHELFSTRERPKHWPPMKPLK